MKRELAGVGVDLAQSAAIEAGLPKGVRAESGLALLATGAVQKREPAEFQSNNLPLTQFGASPGALAFSP
jgi:hypothetical protein